MAKPVPAGCWARCRTGVPTVTTFYVLGRRLLIGIGDLLDPELINESEAPNGKLLLINAESDPEMLSGSWNNPFAYCSRRFGLGGG